MLSGAAQMFFQPSVLSVLLLAAGILVWKRLWSRRLCVAALLVLASFSSARVSLPLVHSLEDQYPDRGIEAIPKAQAIVVLGGTIHSPTSHHPNSGLINPSDRLLQAFRLYRAGKAPVVLCSGGGQMIPEAPAMARLLQEWGVPSVAILLEQQSLNTRENAVFSYHVLKAKDIRHILLVTSALHMPRASAVFRKAGFEVTPAPADFRTGWGGGEGVFGWLIGWLPASDDLQRSERALKEWEGMLIYRLRGWI